MPSAANVFSVIAGIFAVVTAAIYVFGIPPELKRKLERQALKTMGENKASYLVKDQVSKLPASDQKNVKEFQKGVGSALGGGLQNPVGENVGELGDTLTRGFTGR